MPNIQQGTTSVINGLTPQQAYQFRVTPIYRVPGGSSQASGTTDAFAPSDITGLQLWLDASDDQTLYDATTGGSLVAADGSVARWEDKSGNDRHATQGTSGSRPLRKASVQNGLDVLRFDGSDDMLQIPSSTAVFKFLHFSESTVFVVVKCGTSANPETLMSLLNTGLNSASASRPGGYSLIYDDRVGNTLLQDGSTARNDCLLTSVASGVSLGACSTSDNGLLPAQTFKVLSFVGDMDAAVAADRMSVRSNGGAAVKTNAATNTPANVNAETDLAIGARQSDLAAPLDGDMCEIIVYNSALGDTDREAVEDYLLAKWGIS